MEVVFDAVTGPTGVEPEYAVPVGWTVRLPVPNGIKGTGIEDTVTVPDAVGYVPVLLPLDVTGEVGKTPVVLFEEVAGDVGYAGDEELLPNGYPELGMLPEDAVGPVGYPVEDGTAGGVPDPYGAVGPADAVGSYTPVPFTPAGE
ncbi:hypothetical protein Tdes44962_MAKER03923 [Teratosphaeria destructans]|uniref:Uncharacterized protein n=1 Tax=Teratosphaeria destructans TaxID=418781 RepID=A0A9W7W122_9PEZI|nr:hypothetical protein Tdes44962_MAKER03923 [Teratosphaeria destructans]